MKKIIKICLGVAAAGCCVTAVCAMLPKKKSYIVGDFYDDYYSDYNARVSSHLEKEGEAIPPQNDKAEK